MRLILDSVNTCKYYLTSIIYNPFSVFIQYCQQFSINLLCFFPHTISIVVSNIHVRISVTLDCIPEAPRPYYSKAASVRLVTTHQTQIMALGVITTLVLKGILPIYYPSILRVVLRPTLIEYIMSWARHSTDIIYDIIISGAKAEHGAPSQLIH